MRASAAAEAVDRLRSSSHWAIELARGEGKARAADPTGDTDERITRRARVREEMLASVSGAQLAEIRKQLGLTQSQLAETAGLSQARISQIEKGIATSQRSTLAPAERTSSPRTLSRPHCLRAARTTVHIEQHSAIRMHSMYLAATVTATQANNRARQRTLRWRRHSP